MISDASGNDIKFIKLPLFKKRLLNVGLHGITLVARFLLIFLLAKNLSPESVGYYGLFAATIGYSLYFVGLDFYTYVTREMAATSNKLRGQLLRNQLALSAALYPIFLPIALLIIDSANWPTHLMWWFIPLLILEHFNQEVQRLLVALSEQVTATWILFLRQGSWALVAAFVLTWLPASRNLETILVLWACAGLLAAITGIAKIKSMGMGGWQQKTDWHWIRNGIKVSIYFLLATLAIRGIQTIDRYWIEALGGIEIVGAYVLLFGVAGTLLTFLDAGLFSFTYPELIRLHHAKEAALARAKVRQLLISTTALCVAFVVVSWFMLPYLLRWIDKPVYSDSLYLYPWLLCATVVNAVGLVPHYALYAQGQDKAIVYSHVAALGVFLLSTWLTSAHFSTMAILIGLNLSFLLILIWKSVAYWQYNVKFDTLTDDSPHSRQNGSTPQ